MEDIWIYGTNIYLLYDDIEKEYGGGWTESGDDIDLPFVISKLETAKYQIKDMICNWDMHIMVKHIGNI